MKTFKRCVLFLSVIMIIVSCSITKKVEKGITAKWEIVSIEHTEKANISDNYTKLYKDLLGNSYIEFKEDHTFELNVYGKTKSDSWNVSEDGQKILSSTADHYFIIKSRSENAMTLKSVKGKDNVLIKLKRL